MDTKLMAIRVGEPFTVFPTGIQNGAVLEALPDGGLMLGIYLLGMKPSERLALERSRVMSRALVEGSNMLLLIRFAGDLIFEISFDPGLYPDTRRDVVRDTNLIHIVGVDSANNIIQMQRLVSIPRQLKGLMDTHWGSAAEGHSDQYRRWVDGLYARHTTKQLWGMARSTGTFGGEV